MDLRVQPVRAGSLVGLSSTSWLDVYGVCVVLPKRWEHLL